MSSASECPDLVVYTTSTHYSTFERQQWSTLFGPAAAYTSGLLESCFSARIERGYATRTGGYHELHVSPAVEKQLGN